MIAGTLCIYHEPEIGGVMMLDQNNSRFSLEECGLTADSMSTWVGGPGGTPRRHAGRASYGEAAYWSPVVHGPAR
jgi:hypothetical protein